MTQETTPAVTEKDSVNILVYSDNRDVRSDVINGVGRKVGAGKKVNWVEAATHQGALLKVKEGDFDLLILDAEAPKMGGIGVGKTVRDEIDENMPFIILIARPQDEWLARVSKPNVILSFPVDGREISSAVADILG